jgi:AdoMet-dependent heme synthase
LKPDYSLVPRLVAWETTVACPLACRHCRAEAQTDPNPDQLTTDEGKSLIIDEIAVMAKMAGVQWQPTLILSGGEPLMRTDIFDLAAYSTSKGLNTVISPDDGRLVKPDTIQKLKEAGVRRISFSLHYPTPEKNDYFARREGTFVAALEAFENLRSGQMPFQINTTVTKQNIADLPALLDLVKKSGAVAWHVFLLVPTGRGKQIANDELPPEEYERALNWLYDVARSESIEVKPTCAPHYYRVIRQRSHEDGSTLESLSGGHSHPSGLRTHTSGKGCLAGNGFCFVSNVGEVNPCGYLPVSAGNVRKDSFHEIYQNSNLFAELRDTSLLQGKCGPCEFRNVCGGCRARAYALNGNYMGAEPHCTYVPAKVG